jgi:hypothetical protein
MSCETGHLKPPFTCLRVFFRFRLLDAAIRRCFAPGNETRLTCGAVIFCGFLLMCGSSVYAQQKVGFVLEMHGKWTDGDPRRFLKLGELLPGEAVLSNTSSAENDSITVADLHGRIIKTIRCKNAVCRECTESGACYDPIHPLPKSADSNGTLSTLLNAVLDLFTEKPERYSIHRVRGTDPEVAPSEVIRLDGNSLDVGLLFQGKEKGRYEVQFLPISQREKSGQKRQPLKGEINWNPGEPTPFALPGLVPDLYEVFLYRGSSPTTAWVLVSSGTDYQRALDSFDEFVRQTDSWGKDVTPATKQAYQRAFLEYLDLHTSGSGR